MNMAQKFESLVSSTGRDIAEIEREARVPRDTLRNILRGISRDPGVAKVHKLAHALGTTVESIFGAEDATAGWQSEMPIRFKTGGGAWVEVDRYNQVDTATYPAALLPSIPLQDQWYEELVGDSIDKLVPPGALMHVVSTGVMGYTHGDIVIVERKRFGGHLIDRSAKQVAMTSHGVQLWPRSTNKSWDGPISVTGDAEDESLTVDIVGVVKRAVLRF